MQKMNNLSPGDKQFLEQVLKMNSGYVLDFSDKSFRSFFNDININIDDHKYLSSGTSKAKRLRTFWRIEDNKKVGKVILELSKYFDTSSSDKNRMESIAKSLINMPNNKLVTPCKNNCCTLTIKICPEIYNHIERYLKTNDYFHALEEAYKIVRKKLQNLTGEEKATNAFAVKNYPRIFGHNPSDNIEKDFFEGIKFLNMAIQNFRNETSHSLAKSLDKNVAIHYLALASLAYDLITRNGQNK